ncbi:MAG: thiamine-binding protein [Halioglobus sp.]|nr:thiamine-binding protein [Halioglobus sp.]
MKLTVEISLYPLQDDYIPVIEAFIAAAREHGDLDIVTNAMSTQICGDYDRVFALLRQELKVSYREHGRQVLVCKLIPGELAIRR